MNTDTGTAIDFELAHRVHVQTDPRVWGLGSRAVCSCGWASGWLPGSSDATQAGAEHVDTAIGPPDALDHAMNIMLDLQEDLAETVVWLAENWSADLPAPGVYGGIGYLRDPDVAGARLLVFCETADELARVAARLGAPVRTRLEPVTGRGFDAATRDFGRVRVEAYTESSTAEAVP